MHGVSIDFIMKLYLDMCVLKRPFDDTSQPRIEREAKAALAILERVELGLDQMVWSTALTVENEADPDVEARIQVKAYEKLAFVSQGLTVEVEARARSLVAGGIRPLDSLHLALAEASKCDCLLTCDDTFAKRIRRVAVLIRVENPIEYMTRA